ncbi:DUF1853 family protein [Microbulbifer sp. ANSA003]|uniref:DUF1853 family protein n=1 Tax=Microbulbifer sp. ANSA003 TaxID=3243360 RepID=UPI004042583D
MTQETIQKAMISSLKSGQVDNWDNLMWSVGSSDIPTSEDSVTAFSAANQLPWLLPTRRKSLLEYFSCPKVKNALSPELDNYLHELNLNKPNNRLGTYFERLWSFAFDKHPDYQLLYQNLPLRSGGKTLGELDFVVQHLPSNQCEHWEIAVKFYLQVTDIHWVGPGIKDRLDIKLARMADHQLPLIEMPAVQSMLKEHGLEIDRQWALMPGRLFKPLDTLRRPSSHDLWWVSLSEFRSFSLSQVNRSTLEWLALPKQTWLAPQSSTTGMTADQLLEALLPESFTHPLCIAAVDKNGEACRGFIVPDNWYQRAKSSLSI